MDDKLRLKKTKFKNSSFPAKNTFLGADSGFTPYDSKRSKDVIGIELGFINKLRNKISLLVNCRTGFTLVEVLIAASILAVGMVIIYEIFLLSLDAAGFTVNRLNAQMFSNEKIWQMQDNHDQQRRLLFPAENSGQVILNNRIFDWQLNMQLLDSKHELSLLELTVNWKDGNRERKFSRSAIVMKDFCNVYPKEK